MPDAIRFKRTSPAIDESDLAEVEERFGFQFPNEFRIHYLKFNGGYPDRPLLRREGEEYLFHQFLPIKQGRTKDELVFDDVYADLVLKKKVFPKGFVPFAYDEGGEFYCFSTLKKDYGSIYLYVTEYVGTPREPKAFLANSLDELFARLEKDD